MPGEKLQLEWYLTEPDLELKRLLISVMPPEKLQPQWLEKEGNPELRRLLKQRIGYE
ncbi:MAG: hypothetical protein WBB28_03845 [Crinalium sp.]